MSKGTQTPTHDHHGGHPLFLIVAPLAGLLVWWVLPEVYTDAAGEVIALSAAARAVAGIAVAMAVLWMTEAISVYATALLPLALFPLAGIADINTVAASYSEPVVYLFLGGFVLALALEKWGLHRRLALNVLAAVGSSPGRIVAAFMFLAALLSMWLTNTATTIMLLPVALSVIALLPGQAGEGQGTQSLALCLLLGIAYASSIGGMGTIVGTAPNAFLVGFVAENLGRDISFLDWMRFAVPVVLVLLPLAWLVLTQFVYPLDKRPIAGAAEALTAERQKLRPLTRGEWLTLGIFLVTALAWVMRRPVLNPLEIGGVRPFAGLTDAGIAISAAMLLFLCPVSIRERQFLMDWQTAVRLPWGLLILFGGGLSLAAQLTDTGFSAYLGYLASGLDQVPAWLIILAVVAAVVFLTELTSNTATTATLVPVFFALSDGLGLASLSLMIPATLAASCAFMLPVATPPNAIVFGSGYVRIRQMARAGLWLNLVSVVVLTLAALWGDLAAVGGTGQ